MIALIDHGMGNLGSVQNMLRTLGAACERTTSKDEIRQADGLILAGVGAFDGAMERLDSLGLIDVLHEQVFDRRVPVLGVCLGLQLMARSSSEGRRSGLGWLDASVQEFAFPDGEVLPTPHMGWEVVTPIRPSPLLVSDEVEQRFYFSHAYHLVCNEPSDVAATATYGYTFPAAIHRGNIHGTQFHPEKSHAFGMALYRRFLGLAVD